MPLIFPSSELITCTPPWRPSHQNHFWHEAILPINGHYHIELDDGTGFQVPPGQAVLIPAGVGHRNIMPTQPPDKNLTFYCTMWQEGLNPIKRPAAVMTDGDGHLLYLSARMWRYTQHRTMTADAITQLEHMAIMFVASLNEAIDANKNSIGDQRITLILNHLRLNLHEQNRIEDLAALVGMSADGFGRLFKKHTTMSPSTYLQHMRVERAIAQLASTEHSLEDIAKSIGYSSPSHLSRLIRRTTGRSATSFRTRLLDSGPQTIPEA